MRISFLILSFLMASASISLGQSNKTTSLSFNVNGKAAVQTDYYYYRGKKIPLTINRDKVCISIPKNNERTSEKILSDIVVQDRIKSEKFDIYIILRSEFERLVSSDSWEETGKSVIVTPSYRTMCEKEVFLTPHVIVRLKKVEDIDILTSYAEKFGLKIERNNPLMPLWYGLSVTQDCDKSPLECANLLWESGMFASSAPDFSAKGLTCSNDPMFDQQWGLYNSVYTDVDISASEAWNYATGKNVKIAIFDTGVDLNHIDLYSNISSLSYDTESSLSPSVIYDNQIHGTHCAGIAAAVKDNGIQIAGVAPESTIISISNGFDLSDYHPLKVAEGIVWAYQHGADVISNSWYSPTNSDAIEEAIQDAFRYGRQGKGCVVVFAAGNDNDSVNYPANCNDTILVVGAIFRTGTRWFHSNYGTKLDLVAPGHNILSTIPNNLTTTLNGTSMACPHVAGVAALILERNPELTVTQVNSIINSNAKKLQGVNFNISKPDGLWNNEYGYGLVDAYNSLVNTPSVVYIQNDTIIGTRTISADNIYVGRNVTDRKEYGDVILGQGNITLKGNFIEIRNSTTVPLGTTLTLEN